MGVQRRHLTLVAAAASARMSDGIPAGPPPEVREQVGAALERAQDLAAQDRELHFARDPGTGRVIVQVRDLEGTVLRTIPPSEALEVMAGAREV